MVELKQGAYDPKQFQSEMSNEFRGRVAPRQQSCPAPETQVHLGSHTRRMETQYQSDTRPGQSIPPVYNGVSKWPKYPPFDPINGNIRPAVPSNPMRKSQNFAHEHDRGIRDPVLGVVRQRPAHSKPTSAEIVARANYDIPPLRSCGAVRGWA